MSVVDTGEEEYVEVGTEGTYEEVEDGVIQRKIRSVLTECNIVLGLIAMFGLLVLLVKNIWY